MCDDSIKSSDDKNDDNLTTRECTDKIVTMNIFVEKNVKRDISVINSKINTMGLNKMRSKFKWFHSQNTDVSEYKKQLKLRLANIIRDNASSLYENTSCYPYYVIVDFEATCELINPENYRHEIIEFPAVLIDSKTLEIKDKFRRFCRPTFKQKLSEFCIELTGVTQEEIDNADSFCTVLKSFQKWLNSHQLGTRNKFSIVCDGPWDMTRFLFVQCILSNVEYPQWAEKWVDIRRIFKKFYQQKRSSLSAMLEYLDMDFEGRPHCGLDDAINISKVVRKMICDGAVLQPNQVIAPTSKNAKTNIKESVDDEKEIIEQLNDLSFEAEKLPVRTNGKIVTHRDIKIERTRKIHYLAKRTAPDCEFAEIILPLI